MDAARLASAIPMAEFAGIRQPDDPISILLVHDDGSYRRRLANELSKRGFAVRSFANGRELLSALGAGIDADIIVALARGTSNMREEEFLAELDRQGVDLPVIFLPNCQALTVICCGLA
jgi:DNA-binding NtrC family response regulator